MKRKYFLLVLFLVSIIFLTGCNKQKALEDTVIDYFSYLNNENWELAGDIAEPSCIEHFKKIIQLRPEGARLKFVFNSLYDINSLTASAMAKVNYSIYIYLGNLEIDKINQNAIAEFIKVSLFNKWKIHYII
jgi:hypothetical protein